METKQGQMSGERERCKECIKVQEEERVYVCKDKGKGKDRKRGERGENNECWMIG